jgi:single-strand DNA-binding protein
MSHRKARIRKMNKVILIGRLVRDPEIRWTQGQDVKCTARYTLAVDRKVKKDSNQQSADFISCVSWGKTAEFVEKYLKKGIKIAAEGRIITGSYTNKEGTKVYTTDVAVDTCEFVESKKAAGEQSNANQNNDPNVDDDGFVNVPDEIDEELPFS